jgi:hypothetical protein
LSFFYHGWDSITLTYLDSYWSSYQILKHFCYCRYRLPELSSYLKTKDATADTGYQSYYHILKPKIFKTKDATADTDYQNCYNFFIQRCYCRHMLT